ncbi:MAG: phospholipase D-like domain-containing protein [Syntrophorhabdaceae bacterium]
MKTFFIVLCLSFFSLFACQDKSVSPHRPGSKGSNFKSASAELYLDGCPEAILKEICEAKSEIFVESQSLSSAAVAGALIEAHKGGLKVEAIVGKNQRKKKDSPAGSLASAGIPVYLDGKRAINRDETIVIDGKTVITGSFDCNEAADGRDIEKLTVARSPEVAAIYMKNWKNRKQHAKAYEAKVAATQNTVRKRKP